MKINELTTQQLIAILKSMTYKTEPGAVSLRKKAIKALESRLTEEQLFNLLSDCLGGRAG